MDISYVYILMMVSLFVGFIVAYLCSMYLKTQVFFQRAYVEVEGEYIDTILNIFKIDSMLDEKERVDVNLVGSLLYKDKDGKLKSTKSFVRISKRFFKLFVYSGEREEINKTLAYLINKIEKNDLRVLEYGYY